MSVFTRLTDIIQSNVVMVLDKAEQPEKLVRLMIEEMEQTLVEVRSTQAALIADKKSLQRTLEKHLQSVTFWQQKAEIAVDKQRDDLAKSALIEKNKVQQQADSLALEFNKIEDALNKLKADSDCLREKLQQAKAKQASIVQREESASARLKLKTQIHSENINNALAKFDEIERKVDEIEAKVESYEISPTPSLAQEINALEENDEIEQQLAELKKQTKQAA